MYLGICVLKIMSYSCVLLLWFYFQFHASLLGSNGYLLQLAKAKEDDIVRGAMQCIENICIRYLQHYLYVSYSKWQYWFLCDNCILIQMYSWEGILWFRHICPSMSMDITHSCHNSFDLIVFKLFTCCGTHMQNHCLMLLICNACHVVFWHSWIWYIMNKIIQN